MACICVVRPTGTEATSLLTAMAVSPAEVTDSGLAADKDCTLAAIVADPWELATASPALLTATTLGLELVHWAEAVRSCREPSVKLPKACICVFWPIAKD